MIAELVWLEALPVTILVDAFAALLAGPRERAAEDVPPETIPPPDVVDAGAAVRMYTWRKSLGSF